MREYRVLLLSSAFLFAFLLTGCGGHKSIAASVPPPPSAGEEESDAGLNAGPDGEVDRPSPSRSLGAPEDAKPLLVETGVASWYGPPYNHRRSSNGEVYNMHAMTAAHRTLPLGTLVRVTNVKTGNSALVRITDRGPFIAGRILDLSEAAAKKVDVYGPGTAMVRVEVLRTPTPLESGGRWAVQIGAFEKEHAADKVAGKLTRRYQTAKVQCFSSPIGNWWVRVRVLDDDRQRAEEVARHVEIAQQLIFLVRLD